jgi:hypothetical protein
MGLGPIEPGDGALPCVDGAGGFCCIGDGAPRCIGDGAPRCSDDGGFCCVDEGALSPGAMGCMPEPRVPDPRMPGLPLRSQAGDLAMAGSLQSTAFLALAPPEPPGGAAKAGAAIVPASASRAKCVASFLMISSPAQPPLAAREPGSGGWSRFDPQMPPPA